MASGCILGDCPACDYPVFEDEWSGVGFDRYGKFIHTGECLQKYTMETKERQIIRKKDKEIRELREEIERLTLENADLIKRRL